MSVVSDDTVSDDHIALSSRETGHIYWRAEQFDEEELLPDDINDPEHRQQHPNDPVERPP